METKRSYARNYFDFVIKNAYFSNIYKYCPFEVGKKQEYLSLKVIKQTRIPKGFLKRLPIVQI